METINVVFDKIFNKNKKQKSKPSENIEQEEKEEEESRFLPLGFHCALHGRGRCFAHHSAPSVRHCHSGGGIPGGAHHALLDDNRRFSHRRTAQINELNILITKKHRWIRCFFVISGGCK